MEYSLVALEVSLQVPRLLPGYQDGAVVQLALVTDLVSALSL